MNGISNKDFERWGCPHCGGRTGYVQAQGPNVVLWACNCGKGVAILRDGVTKARDFLFSGKGVTLRAHPRATSTPPLESHLL